MKNWRWLAIGAVVALGVGCQKEREQGEQSAEQFQQKSEDAFDRAKEAQEKASDEQQQAQQAREDVQQKQQELTQTQQELTEAQQKAQQEAQQATQAQQQAQQQSQQASQESVQYQQQAAAALQTEQQQTAQTGQPPAAGTGGSAQQGDRPAEMSTEVNGTVVRSEETGLSVRTQDGNEVNVRVRPETQVMLDGRQATLAEVPEGAQVRASFDAQGQGASRIEVTTSGTQQGYGGAGQAGETPTNVPAQTDIKAQPSVSTGGDGTVEESSSGQQQQ